MREAQQDLTTVALVGHNRLETRFASREDDSLAHIQLLGRTNKGGPKIRPLPLVQCRLDAGHGLTYRNVKPVAAIEGMRELNIGHTIIARAIMVGLEQAVRDMKRLIS